MKHFIILGTMILGFPHFSSAQSDTIGYFKDTSLIAYKGKVCDNKPCGHWTIFCKSGKPSFEVKLNEDEYEVNDYDAVTGMIYQKINLKASKTYSVEDQKKNKFLERYLIPAISPAIYRTACSPYDLELPRFNFSSNYFDEGSYTTFYPTGQLRYQIILKNGRINGIYKEYHPDGSLYCEGSFKDNQKIGIWKYYFENGKLMAKGEYLRLLIYDYIPGKDTLIIRNDYDKIEEIKAGPDYTNFVMQANKKDKYLIYIAQETLPHFNGKLEELFNIPFFIGTFLKKGRWEEYDESGKLSYVEYIDGIKSGNQ